MSRPLKVDNSNSQFSLREMSDFDIEYIIYRVLFEFANSQSGPGTINIDGNGTQIGTFTDTSRPYSVGEHPIGTDIQTNNIFFYQDRSSITPNPSARPVIWTDSVKASSDSELTARVISSSAAELVNGGIGSYILSPSTPANGSWIIIDSFNDTSADGTQVFNLYRKVNDTEPPAVRPLKTDGGGLREMTDSEIASLVDNLRDYINNTGIGYYALQPSAPTDGTYVEAGSASDLRNEIADENYVGAKTYTGTQSFTRFFSGTTGGTFTGERNFVGTSAYTGLTLQNSQETVGTVTLWLRQS